MKTIDVKGSLRTEVGKKETHRLRKQNIVPCILYGIEKDENNLPVATAFAVPTEGLRKLIYTPHIYVVNLTIGEKTVNAILKDIQFHPVKDTILHVDFYQINEEKPIIMNVPVTLTGLAEGVKSGGKLSQVLRKLKVKAIYSDIPEKLVIDVTHLSLGKSIKVGDLSYDKLELLNVKNAVVCTVKTTRTSVAVEETAADTAAE